MEDLREIKCPGCDRFVIVSTRKDCKYLTTFKSDHLQFTWSNLEIAEGFLLTGICKILQESGEWKIKSTEPEKWQERADVEISKFLSKQENAF